MTSGPDSTVDSDTPPDSLDDSDLSAQVLLTNLAPQAHVDDLGCTVSGPGATGHQWFRDGLVWDGDVAARSALSSTIPSSALAAGRRWTCVLEGGPDDGLSADAIAKRPDVVLLFADDLGFGDVGAFGAATGVTPRIDTLADEGVRFTEGYASAPVCSPSRAGIFTGRQGSRFGFEYNVGASVPERPRRGLPITERTLGDVMQDAGYTTALFGKWHLGYQVEHRPWTRGFDHFFGFLSGQRSMTDPAREDVLSRYLFGWTVEQWDSGRIEDSLIENGELVTLDDRHLTDRLADEAITWMQAQPAEDSLLMVVAFNAPHIPLQATPEHLALVPDPPTDDDDTLAYLGMVVALDRAIGRVVDALEAAGRGDALIIVTSDNGCVDVPYCSNGPLNGAKGSLMEGGVRVPYVLRWPGVAEPGTTSDALVSTLDILPTFAGAAGLRGDALPELDGLDLRHHLQGRAEIVHDALYWRILPARAIRRADAKLTQVWQRSWLYDLGSDLGEASDLSKAQPADVLDLEARLVEQGLLYQSPAWQPQWTEASYYDSEPQVVGY